MTEEQPQTYQGIPVIPAGSPERFIPPRPIERPEGADPVFAVTCWSRGLTADFVVEGYRRGGFPWPSPEVAETKLYPWGRLFPCTVLPVSRYHLTHSMKKRVRDAMAGHYRGHPLKITLDPPGRFGEIIDMIAADHRSCDGGTWMLPGLVRVWKTLARRGNAHAVLAEVDGRPAGGLYFTSVGRMVYGESMFRLLPDISKLALAGLAAFCLREGLPLIDCQMLTAHTAEAGAGLISGKLFLKLNDVLANAEAPDWKAHEGEDLIAALNDVYKGKLTPRAPTSEGARTSLFVEKHGSVGTRLLGPVPTGFLNSPCSYYPERDGRVEALLSGADDPQTGLLYNELVRRGFRRDATVVYRCRCKGCRRCIPTRLDAKAFAPDRTMRKTLKRHAGLVMTVKPLAPVTDEQYALYKKYEHGRHRGGTMDRMDRAAVNASLFTSVGKSAVLEFRTPADAPEPNALRLVCIIDYLDNAISAVYNFFDPDEPRSSLGTFGILAEIEYARRCGLRWVYLGYWLPGYPGMDYKTRFQPLDVYWKGRWTAQSRFSAEVPASELSEQPS
jgi:arginine-tRNA-protein transferase